MRTASPQVGHRADEPHRDGLSAGDRVLIYLAAPARVFIALAELASSVGALMPDQPETNQLHRPRGVLLDPFDWWDPPVRMDAVLPRIDPANKATADFETTTSSQSHPPSSRLPPVPLMKWRQVAQSPASTAVPEPTT